MPEFPLFTGIPAFRFCAYLFSLNQIMSRFTFSYSKQPPKNTRKILLIKFFNPENTKFHRA